MLSALVARRRPSELVVEKEARGCLAKHLRARPCSPCQEGASESKEIKAEQEAETKRAMLLQERM